MDAVGTDSVEIALRASQLASVLEANPCDQATLASLVPDIVRTLRAASDALANSELDRMMIEAKDEQIALQSEMLEAIGYPVLLVGKGVLCTPVIGPIDFERARRLMDVALQAAVQRSAHSFVIDLTGAIVEDANVTSCISDVARALSLVGVRVALSGIRADMAKLLAEQGGAWADTATYPTLAAALAAIRHRGDELRGRGRGGLLR